MRTKNSLNNVCASVFMNVFSIFIGFITQKIFVNSLGKEYLGINGLFGNVLSMLAIVELGFGSAIVYHLYKPVAENNKDKITVLINFYKKVYNIIAFVIFGIGLSITPFVNYIIGDVNIQENISFLFFLALIDVVISYLLTYKRTILYVNQKEYILSIIHCVYLLLVNLFEIAVLIWFKNYTLYLIVKVVFRFLENLAITFIANKKYPYICEKPKEKLEAEIKQDIFQKVKGLLFHKIGYVIVLGTDNIIISKILGIAVVGLYSNYNLIITSLTNLLSQVFSAIIAIVGNLLVEKDKNEAYGVFKNVLFFNSWIYAFCGICLLCLMKPFMLLWMGEDFLLPTTVLIVLVCNFYITGMRKSCSVFKEAAGIFYEDRFVPIIEAVLNLTLSIVLAKLIGLEGVFLGTCISSLVLYLYSFPILVYKKIFDKKYLDYVKEYAYYFGITIVVSVVTFGITNMIQVSSNLMQLIVNGVICVIVPNAIFFVLFRKKHEFKYYVYLVNQFVFKKG